MLSYSTELSTTARYTKLPGLLAFVAKNASSIGVSEAAISRIQLVLEELFSNSINHGYGAECDQLIGIALNPRPGGLTLFYRDHAMPFDLTRANVCTPNGDQVGGLGLNLILGMAQAIRYRREAGSNLTELDL